MTAAKDSRSVVYRIGSDETHKVKIGKSIHPERRLADIQRMSPVELRILWTHPGDLALESALHDEFASYRLHGEWFDFGDLNPAATIAAAAERIEARWEREAAQYAALAAARTEEDRAFAHALRARARDREPADDIPLRGRVYWLGEDDEFGPHVVVSNESRNRCLGTCMVVRISLADPADLPASPTVVLLSDTDPLAGSVRCDQLFHASCAELSDDAGALTPDTMVRVGAGLRSALAL